MVDLTAASCLTKNLKASRPSEYPSFLPNGVFLPFLVTRGWISSSSAHYYVRIQSINQSTDDAEKKRQHLLDTVFILETVRLIPIKKKQQLLRTGKNITDTRVVILLVFF